MEGSSALNRVRWSHSGKEIATGDSDGQVQVYDVGEVSLSFQPLAVKSSGVGLGSQVRLQLLI